MTNLGFNPLVAALSFVADLQSKASWLYARKTDTQGPLTDEDGTETEETGYQTDGSASIHYAVSVGKGRGSAKVELTGNQLESVADALEAYDPEADHSGLDPAECIARTIDRDSDGVTSFKLSLAPNSRAVKIPAGEWDNFCGLMRANAGTVDAAVAHYRNVTEQAEAAANG
jgi:hypothetical protein